MLRRPDVLVNDFFLVACLEDFIENARLFIFETFCRIHQCISISMLADKLNMTPEEAERWIVNLIRNAGSTPRSTPNWVTLSWETRCVAVSAGDRENQESVVPQPDVGHEHREEVGSQQQKRDTKLGGSGLRLLLKPKPAPEDDDDSSHDLKTLFCWFYEFFIIVIIIIIIIWNQSSSASLERYLAVMTEQSKPKAPTQEEEAEGEGRRPRPGGGGGGGHETETVTAPSVKKRKRRVRVAVETVKTHEVRKVSTSLFPERLITMLSLRSEVRVRGKVTEFWLLKQKHRELFHCVFL
ncbi:hypothetical protein INR49_007477 [Caranx melampygus]|nr:hypothetical protein INR49_007477 [Caranx melampygus]